MSNRRVAVMHLADRRPARPDYQRTADRLNGSALATIHSLGWDARLHAAADGSVAEAVDAARQADVIVILGGEDVHPTYYGGAADYVGSGRHLEAGDEAQISVVTDAALRGVPVLGVCRGHQLINVALGGDLIQHLPETGHHRDATPGLDEPFIGHRVALVGDLLGSAVRQGELVQSSHHQAVDRLGRGLRAAAVSEDGVVEAIAHESLPIVGVQWHPEHQGAPSGQFVRLLQHLALSA